MKIVFEVDEASSETEVTRKISPVCGKCTGAVALLLQGFAQRCETAEARTLPSKPRLRLDIANSMFEQIAPWDTRDVGSQTPRPGGNRVLKQYSLLRDAIKIWRGWAGVTIGRHMI